MNNNQRQTVLLQEPFGTACTKLRKMILFHLLKKYKENFCYRCSKEIETIQELSIEHKEAWLNSNNPIEKFYDLNNIAFSHLHCNRVACVVKHTEEYKKTLSLRMSGEKHPQAKLTANKVREIRKLVNEDKILVENVAKQFQISCTTVWDIKNFKSWKSVK
jgi:hypothetical protein